MTALTKLRICQSLLGMGVAALYLSFPFPYLDVKYFNKDDPAAYLVEARVLASGGGFGIYDGDLFMPTKVHPPGLSLLIAPVIFFAGINFFAVKYCLIAVSLAVILVAYRFVRAYTDRYRATACALLFALSPVTFILSRIVLGEIAAVGCSMAALIGFNRLFCRGKTLSGLALCSAAVGCASMIKGLGLALLLAPLPALVIMGRRRLWGYYLLFLALASIPGALFLNRNNNVESYGFWGRGITYACYGVGTPQGRSSISEQGTWWDEDEKREATGQWERLRAQARADVYNPLQLLFPAGFSRISQRWTEARRGMGCAAIGVALLLAWIFVSRLMTRGDLFIETGFCASLIMILMLRPGGALRYWYIAICPLLLVYVADADSRLARRMGGVWRGAARIPWLTLFLVVMMVPPLIREVRGLGEPFELPRDELFKSYTDAAQWVVKHRAGDGSAYCVVNIPLNWQALTGMRTLSPLGMRALIADGGGGRQPRLILVALKKKFMRDARVGQPFKRNNDLSECIIDAERLTAPIHSTAHWDVYETALTPRVVSAFELKFIKTGRGLKGL